MYKKIKTLIILTFLLICFTYSFKYNNYLVKDTITSINIFIKNLFPSIFFFYLITSLLINYKLIDIINFLFNKLFKLIFHIDKNSIFIIIVSIFGGTPSGPKYIMDFYNKDLITKEVANYLLTFTFFSNPIFLLSVIGSLYGINISKIVMLTTYLSNIIIGIILRPKETSKETSNNIIEKKFSIVLEESIKNIMNLSILILGTSIFFFIISNIFTLNITNNYLKIFIYGLCDLTKGIINLKKLNLNNYNLCLYIIFFITTGSLSIIMQVKEIIKEKLEFKYFLLGRILSLVLSIIILTCYYTIFIV